MKTNNHYPIKSLAATLLLLGLLFNHQLSAQAVSQVIFEDNFEEGAFGPAWTARPNLDGFNGMVEIGSDYGFYNSFGALLSKNSYDQSFTTNALDLTLDLRNHPQVALEFLIGENGETTQSADGLFFSDDGGNTFTKVLAFEGDEWCGSYGAFPPIDVDELAQKHGLNHQVNDFVIRWQQRGSGYYTYGNGIYLDEVKLYVPNLVYAQLPFEEGFENGAFGPNWAWRFADSTASNLALGPITRTSNAVGVKSGYGANGSSYFAYFSNYCYSGFVTNALDLHLDLEGHDQVALSFWLWHKGDETQNDDGIYFSDDGGKTFKKVFSFETSEWCEIWGSFPDLDVDKLAKAHGLVLSSNFVIRFQQRGNESFNYGQGIFLDDIKVFVPNKDYAELPYITGFEDGQFDTHWVRRFADQTSSLSTNHPATRISNIVAISSGYTHEQSGFSVMMGNDCYGSFVANALDFQVNLAQKSNVMMTFHIMDDGEVSQSDDALFFSNDGGRNFEKVYQFDWASTSDVFRSYNFNISEWADTNNVVLGDSFVVRFQQYGDQSYRYGQAIYLDDFSIQETATSVGPNNNIDLTLYPNPGRDFLKLQLPDGSRASDPTIWDIRGVKRLLPYDPSSSTLDISSLSPGIYILKLRLGKQTITKRFSKI